LSRGSVRINPNFYKSKEISVMSISQVSNSGIAKRLVKDLMLKEHILREET